MMSVGILSASLSRAAGGIAPIMQAQARELQRQGVRVVVHGVNDSQFADTSDDWGEVVPIAHEPVLRRLAYAPRLSAAVQRGSFNIVHLHGLWLYPSVVASRWRRRSGRPLIISTQGMLEPWSVCNSRLRKQAAALLFERSNLENAACIICSAAEVNGVRAFGIGSPIAVLPNGVDLPNPIPRRDTFAFEAQKGRRTVLFLGRLHPKKGLLETVDAWGRLKREAPEVAARWRLKIAGWDEGGHEQTLRARVAELGLGGDEVQFAGRVFGAEKDATLRNADAFILTSYSEGFPMAVLEAFAYQLPVFMTRRCNVDEGFKAGAAVEITTDAEKLAAILATHLAREDLAELGARGRVLAEQAFSWEAVAEKLVRLYAWVLGSGSKPDFVILKQ